MIFVINSQDIIFQKQIIEKIVKDNNVEYFATYDLDEFSLSSAIEDLNTYSFLDEKKAILIKNLSFLRSSSKKEDNLDEKILTNYLNHLHPGNILIILESSIDKRKALYKLLVQKANKIYDEEINLESLIKNNLNGFTINNYALTYFISFCDNNSEKIINELNKIKAYKDDPSEITVDDIELICYSSYESNIFKFLDHLSLGDKAAALKLFKALATSIESLNMILAMTHDHFNLILNTKNLLNKGFKLGQIQKELKQKSTYRMEKILSYNSMFTTDNLLQILNELCEIDIANKTNKESFGLFECFIMGV